MHHHHPELILGQWPSLDWQQWKDTAETLQMLTQIVGKTRLALTSTQNHWWNVPLYVSVHGLSTSAMPIAGGHLLEVELDFIRHALLVRTSYGATESIQLRPRAVADFYADYQDTLQRLGLSVPLDRMPVEVADPTPFHQDFTHRAYDPDAVSRFFHVLRLADTVFKRFSTTFYGKISPVHFFWGSFDLAVTRFNGATAPPREGSDPVQQEAYSHQVISAGFWPGNGSYGKAAFYSYAAPTPAGLDRARLSAGRFDHVMGEFLLDYEDVRTEANPAVKVMAFLTETYAAAADAAGWDRAALDRTDRVAAAALRC